MFLVQIFMIPAVFLSSGDHFHLRNDYSGIFEGLLRAEMREFSTALRFFFSSYSSILVGG